MGISSMKDLANVKLDSSTAFVNEKLNYFIIF